MFQALGRTGGMCKITLITSIAYWILLLLLFFSHLTSQSTTYVCRLSVISPPTDTMFLAPKFLVDKFATAHLCCHRDLRARAREKTLARYTRAFEPFSRFICEQGNFDQLPLGLEMDRLISDFRDAENLTTSNHAKLISAVEFFIPETKGFLKISKEAIRGRDMAEPVRHTVPSTSRIVFLFGAAAAARGRARIGAGFIVQAQLGLRPDELTGICSTHVGMPSESFGAILVALGAGKKGTKAKREQFVRVDFEKHYESYMLFGLLMSLAVSGEDRLFPFSYWGFHCTMKDMDKLYDLHLGLTGHSGRACFATENAVVLNRPIHEVIDRGGLVSCGTSSLS